MEDLLQCLKYEDLTQSHKDFADMVGFDAFKALIHQFGGTYLYIPKEDNVVRPARNAGIRDIARQNPVFSTGTAVFLCLFPLFFPFTGSERSL